VGGGGEVLFREERGLKNARSRRRARGVTRKLGGGRLFCGGGQRDLSPKRAFGNPRVGEGEIKFWRETDENKFCGSFLRKGIERRLRSTEWGTGPLERGKGKESGNPQKGVRIEKKNHPHSSRSTTTAKNTQLKK